MKGTWKPQRLMIAFVLRRVEQEDGPHFITPESGEPATSLVLPSQILVDPMIFMLFNIDEGWLMFTWFFSSCTYLRLLLFCLFGIVCLWFFTVRNGNNLGI